MFLGQFKQLWKFFVLIFLVSFLIFNWGKLVLIWNKVILYSNYKFIGRQISSFFEKTFSWEEILKSEKGESGIKKENILEIPKIKISSPIIIIEQTEKTGLNYQELEEKLKQGVLLLSGAKIGERGGGIILGHSAPPSWPAKDYENVFTNLNQLEIGDRVFVYSQEKKYIYEVFDKKIFLPENEKEVLKIRNKEDFVLILLTCWPPGQTNQRIGVLTKLLK